MSRLLIATRNAHKTQEFRAILGREFEIEDLCAHPEILEIAETGKTFQENATIKAVAICQRFPGLVIADDSGLEVDALHGAPGVYSARYAGERATHQKNIEKLLHELQQMPNPARTARFRCVVVLAEDGVVTTAVTGSVEGWIVQSPRGTSGFGYDPVFQPVGFEQTFGELPEATKNEISHRARAMKALMQYFRTS